MQLMRVEADVVRDLRHSVGNHFHKLYYWADRVGAEDDQTPRGERIAELNGALARFQSFLELGLKYFEADRASPIEMAAREVAGASESVLRTELPACGVSVEADSSLDDARIRLDPQRFSFALRLIASLLGGPRRDVFRCRLARGPEETVEISVEAEGGEAPLETPVMEWAIARKAIAVQEGELRRSSRQDDVMGGCVVRLPLGK